MRSPSRASRSSPRATGAKRTGAPSSPPRPSRSWCRGKPRPRRSASWTSTATPATPPRSCCRSGSTIAHPPASRETPWPPARCSSTPPRGSTRRRSPPTSPPAPTSSWCSTMPSATWPHRSHSAARTARTTTAGRRAGPAPSSRPLGCTASTARPAPWHPTSRQPARAAPASWAYRGSVHSVARCWAPRFKSPWPTPVPTRPPCTSSARALRRSHSARSAHRAARSSRFRCSLFPQPPTPPGPRRSSTPCQTNPPCSAARSGCSGRPSTPPPMHSATPFSQGGVATIGDF